MTDPAKLHNALRNYAWGDTTEMSRILDKEPSGEPEAELWMGAHPSAPSQVQLPDDSEAPLDALIADAPAAMLGDAVAERFGPRLPFLFKVLAAGQPLSLQAHPSKPQAEAGFARENKAGIPLDARHRNYKDDNHKPEIICALTPFWALRGFRPHSELITYLRELASPVIEEPVGAFTQAPGRDTLRELFTAIMNLPPDQQDQLVKDVVTYAEIRAHTDDAASWLLRLSRFYPGDIGTVAASLLNVIRLEPGEAMYLPAGELHAYLSGVGIELMANSDNVLRGGLTQKHVDVDELQSTLTFAAGPVQLLSAVNEGVGEGVYETPSPEFRLSTLSLNPQIRFASGARHSLEILFCREGQISCQTEQRDSHLSLTQGESIVIPAAAGPYHLEGSGILFRARVPA